MENRRINLFYSIVTAHLQIRNMNGTLTSGQLKFKGEYVEADLSLVPTFEIALLYSLYYKDETLQGRESVYAYAYFQERILLFL